VYASLGFPLWAGRVTASVAVSHRVVTRYVEAGRRSLRPALARRSGSRRAARAQVIGQTQDCPVPSVDALKRGGNRVTQRLLQKMRNTPHAIGTRDGSTAIWNDQSAG
jgi:hypothetical protein